MIEKMRSVCVAARASRKDELLLSLRDLGMLHLAVKRAAENPAFNLLNGRYKEN